MDTENKRLAIDVAVATSIFFVACFVGKAVMANVGDGGFSFGIPSIGILIVGVVAWLRIRKI